MAAHFALAFLARQHGQGSNEPEAALGPSTQGKWTGSICSERSVQEALTAGRISDVAACGTGVLSARSSEELRVMVVAALFDFGHYAEA